MTLPESCSSLSASLKPITHLSQMSAAGRATRTLCTRHVEAAIVAGSRQRAGGIASGVQHSLRERPCTGTEQRAHDLTEIEYGTLNRDNALETHLQGNTTSKWRRRVPNCLGGGAESRDLWDNGQPPLSHCIKDARQI